MAWTAPRTWTDTELVDATIMNAHVRDNLLALAPDGPDWQTWTPTVGNFTKGNAPTEIARYSEIAGVCRIWYLIEFGSTTTIDSTYPSWTLPASHHASITGNGPAVGLTTLRDDSAAFLYGGPLLIDDDKAYPHLWNHASGSYSRLSALSASAPGSLTTDDILSFTAQYELA